MKRNIPTMRISVMIYDLMMIHDGILPVTDHKRKEVKNNEHYRDFVKFISGLIQTFRSLNVKHTSFPPIHGTAPKRFSFNVTDDKGSPLFKVICDIAVSNHIHPIKALRRYYLIELEYKYPDHIGTNGTFCSIEECHTDKWYNFIIKKMKYIIFRTKEKILTGVDLT